MTSPMRTVAEAIVQRRKTHSPLQKEMSAGDETRAEARESQGVARTCNHASCCSRTKC